MAYPGARGFEAILSEGGTVSDENIQRQDAAEGLASSGVWLVRGVGNLWAHVRIDIVR